MQVEVYGIYANDSARFVESDEPEITMDVDLNSPVSLDDAWKEALRQMREMVTANYPTDEYGYWLVALRYWKRRHWEEEDLQEEEDLREELIEIGCRRLFPDLPLPEGFIDFLLPPEEREASSPA